MNKARLQAGPPGGGDEPDDDSLTKMVKDFQGEKFQQMMVDAIRGSEADAAGVEEPSESGAASYNNAGVDEFLKQFFQSFDNAVGTDGTFEKQLASMMTSMLNKDLLCEPLEKIVEELGRWIQVQKGSLSESDRARYESQLQLYRQVLDIRKNSPEDLPDAQRQEIERLLQELPSLGQLPDAVQQKITPQDVGDGDEKFEDFIKTMGLDEGLSSDEKDLLQKLADDPEELHKVMTEMAGTPEEGCKQQ